MATVTADSCSRSDVMNKIALMSAGDVLIVPAGTADWTGGVNFTGIRVLGAGKSAVGGTIVTAGAVTMTKHASQYTKLDGFRFTGTSRHVLVQGGASDKAFILQSCYLNTNGGESGNTMLRIECNGGLIKSTDFSASSFTSADVMNIQTSETWTDGDDTMGSADTTGERNIYFENSTFSGILETGPDGDQRSRLVIRYCDYTDSSIVFHSGYTTSGGYSDTTQNGGIRHFEIYNNNFIRVSNSAALNKWIWVRGGTGVIRDNRFDKSSSPDNSTYPNKPIIKLSCNCNGQAYPLEFQVGQINKITDATPDKPVLIFSNSAGDNSDGTADSRYINIAASNSGGFGCVNPEFYIQENRDYYQSNQWSHTKYTYPHPLASLDSSIETQTPAKISLRMRMR